MNTLRFLPIGSFSAAPGAWMGLPIRLPDCRTVFGEYLVLDKDIDLEAFGEVLGYLATHFEAFRRERFKGRESTDHVFNELHMVDFSVSDDPEALARGWMQSNMEEPFPEDDILFQFALVKLASNRFLWFKKLDRIHFGNLSFHLINREAAACYNALTTGRPYAGDLSASCF